VSDMDTIKNIAAVLALVGVLFSGYFYIDSTYAQKEHVTAVKIEVVDILKTFKTDLAKDRLEQNYLNAMNLERQYRALVIQYPNDVNLRNDLRQVIKDRADMKAKLDGLRGLQ
jgi:hypothetical protein